ncbi:MAG: hypothetical protein CM1200mP33_3740 [Chloroflexota bacterium]|nr:MAG: hypothetical protein CM1200mP33_3740 [Chloroflexota bacterium]
MLPHLSNLHPVILLNLAFFYCPINSGDGGNANELKSDEFIALLSLTKNGGMYFFISTSIGSVMM